MIIYNFLKIWLSLGKLATNNSPISWQNCVFCVECHLLLENTFIKYNRKMPREKRTATNKVITRQQRRVFPIIQYYSYCTFFTI